jgi:hypothetical protein
VNVKGAVLSRRPTTNAKQRSATLEEQLSSRRFLGPFRDGGRPKEKPLSRMVQMEGKAARARLTDRDGHASAGPDQSTTSSTGESAPSVATGHTSC